MRKHTVTVDPAGLPNGTGWKDIDVSGTALDPIAPGDPVFLNPTSDVNISAFGLCLVYVSASNTLRFGLKLQSGPIDVLVSTP